MPPTCRTARPCRETTGHRPAARPDGTFHIGRPALIVHGGAGGSAPAGGERQAAVERALERGWDEIHSGALAAAVAAVRHMEEERCLNAGLGSCLNSEGIAELDAAVMEGTTLRPGAVGAVRDAPHPIDLALAVMEHGRHVLLVGDGASRFAATHGVETCDPALLIAAATRRGDGEASRPVEPAADTVGAAACDGDGHVAVATSTGGLPGKLPGRVGDSAVPGAGFYADDRLGAACATGLGEAVMRTVLCARAVDQLASGRPGPVAAGAVRQLQERTGGLGGIIVN